MDANGSRFHLVLTREEWFGQGAQPGLEWSDASRVVTLAPLAFLFPAQGASAPPAPQERRGAGRDRYGNWYWIGRDRNDIQFRGARADGAEPFWSANDAAPNPGEPAPGEFAPAVPPAAPAPLALAGLAVTSDHYLVVGTRAPAGLLVFDLHAAGAPFELQWPADVPFDPFDIAPGAGGGVWILDRANRMLWRLDRHFRVCAQRWTSPPQSVVLDFGDAVPGRPCQPAQRPPCRDITLDRALPLTTPHAVAVEGLPDDSVLVLESDPALVHSVLHRYRAGALVGSLSLERALLGRVAGRPDRPLTASDLAIAGHDLAFVPDQHVPEGRVQGMLYIVARSGNQAHAFRIDEAMPSPPAGIGGISQPERQYFPLRLFSGKALVSAGNGAYYDIEDRWVRLATQPRPRFERQGSCTLPPHGSSATAFDSDIPGCVWHRVFIDACVPPDCEIEIESRAADRLDLIERDVAPWQPEPRPYRRGAGSEIPFHQPSIRGPADRVGTWEVLLQQAVGRYLQLRLTLRGSARSTPKLQALRVYYPRFSYVREYLPPLYRDDPGSASFLERFLANAEGFYTDLEGRIENAAALFDNRLVPGEHLEWLASWVSATLDPAWSDERRRFFLSHALRMFRERGTPHGIVRAIRLTLDECVDERLFDEAAQPPFTVRIVERFLSRPAPGTWISERGAAALHEHYARFLEARYGSLDALNAAWDTSLTAFGDVRFTVGPVGDRRRAGDWRRFVADAIGFTYIAPQPSDAPWFRDFLASRYRHVSALVRAYTLDAATGPASFAEIELPAELPTGGAALADWIEFVSIVLPMRRHAHRFTVLVPVLPSEPHDRQRQKMEMARRIAAREKPAHTDFDVGLYWALFRVGEARLGADSILREGSRVTALELGATAIGDGLINPSHPWNVTDRLIAGRERFGGDPTGGTPPVLEH